MLIPAMWELAETYADIYIQKNEENASASPHFLYICNYCCLVFH